MYGDKKGNISSLRETLPYRSLLSGSDAVTLLEFVHASLYCNSKGEFISLYPKLQALLGFDHANAIVGYMDGNSGIVSDFGVNVSMPRGWVREYVARNYLQRDAIVRENFTSYRVQFWSETKKRLPYSREINALCNDFGMREGYTSGSRFTATGKHGSKFCFSGPSMRYDRRTVAILELVTPHLHLALCQLFDKKNADNRNIFLTGREREVLHWLKQGKSSWDTSVILKISERTVNFHVYNLMEKLGVNNRPQAVAVATRLGLIDFD